MKNVRNLNLANYDHLLSAEQLRFSTKGNMLIVGKDLPAWNFALLVSCRTLQTEELLKFLLPVMKRCGSPFRLIKNQLQQYRLNAGEYGDSEVGKVMTIFPQSEGIATEIIEKINSAPPEIKGPVIQDALRLGSILYVQSVLRKGLEVVLAMPDLKQTPFRMPPQFKPGKAGKFLGRRYLKVLTIRSASKGRIFKAINLRNCAFTWCIIKEGKPVALDDHHNRDMRDRLLWQKEVLLQLADHILTPGFIDYFEKNDHSYLVIDHAEGQMLGYEVVEKIGSTPWHALDNGARQELLHWYRQALKLVATVHDRGYVHRDITEANFILLPGNQLCILDFELAFDTNAQRPDPPFLLGTYGYASPEQLQAGVPQFSDDVYSLGALLCFMLTAIHPKEFICDNRQALRKKLMMITEDQELTALVLQCLSTNAGARPFLQEIIVKIEQQLHQTGQKKI